MFLSLENKKPSRMDRYSEIAVALKVSDDSVRRAIREMEKTFDIEVIK
jgi:hypothetical protein